MADDDSTFIFLADYGDEADAQADYDVVKELHAAKAIGSFDAAVIRRDADGKIHVNKDETATRKGAWGGAAVGAVVGILFPPSLLASTGVGALAGGLGEFTDLLGEPRHRGGDAAGPVSGAEAGRDLALKVVEAHVRLHDLEPPVVGLAGFEPTTSSSRTKRATNLRHSPCACPHPTASLLRAETASADPSGGVGGGRQAPTGSWQEAGAGG